MPRSNDHFNEGAGRSQDDFDKKFNDIVLGDKVDSIMSAHKKSFSDIKPIETACASECQHCYEQFDGNSVYNPDWNTMHWRCPKCKSTHDEENWFDWGRNGTMINPFEDDPKKAVITPENIHEHLAEPWPNKRKQTWKEVMTDKWDDDHHSNKDEL